MTGAIKPGQFLSIREVSELVGAPIGNSREAVQQLSQAGFLSVYPNRGIQVAQITPRHTRDAFAFREIIEVHAIRSFMQRASDAEIGRLIETQRAARAALEGLDDQGQLTMMIAVNAGIHSAIVGALDNGFVSKSFDNILQHINWMRANIRITSRRHAEVIDEHIAPRGAELRALRLGGRDLLWSGDARLWGEISPILFPVIGRLPEERLIARGREHVMPLHGFARSSLFDCREAGDAQCTFLLEDTDETRSIYPYAFALQLAYAISEAGLVITASVHNRDSVPMPFNFGLHPGFRLTGKASIRFPDDSALDAHRGVSSRLGPRLPPLTLENGALPVDPERFPGGALMLPAPASRSVVLDQGDDAPRIAVSFPDLTPLALWTADPSAFICIEPWLHLPQHEHASSQAFDRLPGFTHLPPGESWQTTVRITPLTAAAS